MCIIFIKDIYILKQNRYWLIIFGMLFALFSKLLDKGILIITYIKRD